MVYSGADKKQQRSASLALVRELNRSPVNSPHKGPVTRKIFPFDGVIMKSIDCETVMLILQNFILSYYKFPFRPVVFKIQD